MVCVIIPAHNEEHVIGRCLSGLLEGAKSGELEIIVVCNGCRDRTAEVAATFAPAVTVVETATASKTAALNAGDEVATSFPRLYLDADVQMSIRDVRALAGGLAAEGLAASPVPRMDFSRSNWGVRAFYRIWLDLPYVKEGLVGVGVYALSEAGRRRFGSFPQVVNDDGYVRSLFALEERRVVKEAVSTVTAPATLRGLVKIMTRSPLGIYQLNERFSGQMRSERAAKSYTGALGMIAARPGLWPAAGVYVLVNVVTRLRARRQYALGRTDRWERDDTSRQQVGRAIIREPLSFDAVPAKRDP